MAQLSALKKKLVVTTALAAALFGYGRRAYAACAPNPLAPDYLCSGIPNATQNILLINNANVDTAAGFSNTTAAGNAITITGDGALVFTDVYASTITGVQNGLSVTANADYGFTPGSVTIDVNSTITGTAINGILARNYGTGDLSVVADGDVSATVYHGIYARNFGADLTITTGASGTVTGGVYGYGIRAKNWGSGDLTVSAEGDVYASRDSIFAFNIYGSNLTVTTGDPSTVTGGAYGIRAQNNGGGAVAITANGDVTGTTYDGIITWNSGTDLTVTTGKNSTVSGARRGIYANNLGSQTLGINVYGDVSGTSDAGVLAINNGTDLLITTAVDTAVTGGTHGIYARNLGDGALSITANGDVSGAAANGIYGRGYGTDLAVTTGKNSSVTGGARGIMVRNFGTGELTLTALGEVTGAFDGVYASNYGGSTTDVTITTGADSTVTGGFKGIYTFNRGTGALKVTANGDVTGGSRGIYARNSSYGTGLTISTGKGSSVTGTGSDGIYVRNLGSGNVDIAVDGDVTAGSDGIDGFNSSSSTGTFSLSVEGNVTGGSRGIFARQFGAGAITIATGADSSITGTASHGIQARNYSSDVMTIAVEGEVAGKYRAIWGRNFLGTDLIITTGADSTVTGGSYGIVAQNHGSGGELKIAIDGSMVGGNYGVYAHNYAPATNLTITTEADSSVTGTKLDGIYGRNFGSGDFTITADGDITGYIQGIHAQNNAAGANLVIATGADSSVTGGDNGIEASNNGSGALTVTTDGDVTGETSYGIKARNYGAGALAITAGKGSNVAGFFTGIRAYNVGTHLTVAAGAGSMIEGRAYGINAVNSGSGALTVTADGDIRASGINSLLSFVGIYARQDYGPGLTVTTGKNSTITGAYGGSTGIFASNGGTGTLKIVSNGDITVTDNGIYAVNSGTDLTITTGKNSTITGGFHGIKAANFGIGALTVANAKGADVYGGTAGLFVTGMGAAGSSIVNSGVIDSGAYGVKLDSAVISGNLINNGTISALGVAGLYVGGGSDLTSGVDNKGTVTGVTGVKVNAAKISGAFSTSGTIEGTGGTAIDLDGLTGLTPLKVYGGRIIGDVIDDYASNGYSPVTIAGDFTSEGDFTVSDFNVSKGAAFTLGKGFTISSFNTVDVMGSFIIPADPVITGDVSVHTKGLLDVMADTTITGDLTNNGTVSISTGTLVDADTMSKGTGALKFGVASKADHGQLTLNSSPGYMTGQTVTIDVPTVHSFALSDKILLVDGTTTLIGGPPAAGTPVTDNVPLWAFRIIDGTGITDNSDLYLAVDQAATVGAIADTPNNENAAVTLLDLPGGGGPELEEIVDSLGGGDSNEILESVQPAADGGAVVTTLTFVDNSINLTGEHLRALRMADASGMTGISAGELSGASGRRVWFQASAQGAKQGARNGIDGFDSSLVAATIGADTEKALDNTILGMAASYGNTHIDSQNANRTDTDIDNYQLMLYADYSPNYDYYLTGMLGGAVNSHATARHDVGAIPGLNAYGDFMSWQAAARAEAGRVFRTGIASFTPMVTLNWVYYNAEAYTETGAGSASLKVGTQAFNQFDAGIGGRAGFNFTDSAGGRIVPEMFASYRRELIGDRLHTSSSFVGGGAAFAGESPEPAQDRFNVGVQLKYFSADTLELTANYDFDIRPDYTAQAGFLRAGWRF